MVHAIAAVKTDRRRIQDWLVAVWNKISAMYKERASRPSGHYYSHRDQTDMIAPANVQIINDLAQICDLSFCTGTLLPVLTKNCMFFISFLIFLKFICFYFSSSSLLFYLILMEFLAFLFMLITRGDH
jgi:hypothetical protein